MSRGMPWNVHVASHPGSTEDEISNEPDWTQSHQHQVGVLNLQGRYPGLTHNETDSDEFHSRKDDFDREAEKELKTLQEKKKKGELLNFRDLIQSEPDFHLRYPADRSIGWRYVLDTTEDWVKNEQDWPANIRRREKEAQAKQNQQHHPPDGSLIAKTDDCGRKSADSHDSNEEADWKRKEGDDNKHHDAYAAENAGNASDEKQDNEYSALLERYSPQEIALLRSLQHERDYRRNLMHNDGKHKSPQTKNRTTISIDEQDQFSPDNWLPRSECLIRLTGKHPLNAEADLSVLYSAGLITPNELHYVRNHGAVPRLLWEFHKLDVENGKLVLSMNDLKNKFTSFNIPVLLACDGNRRKELNMLKKSKGFNWGPGAVGCAYWRGPLLRDVLIAAGTKDEPYSTANKHRWVNFQGADDLSEGKYETCIPLEYAMDPRNDVVLAYEMNNVPLPPDHGYPVRLMIPGYVGGRCVKWLQKIWLTYHENESHYHIWDNRVLPNFVTEKDGEFARTMFNHPDTACNEQNLNSVIVRPAQGEKIPLSAAIRGKTYRIEGYAYDGGGHEVQRVEVSLDGGATWLYCIRKFPDYPIRHGNKFWTWLHWHVDVSIIHLLQSSHISVRAWNVFKNTQVFSKPAFVHSGIHANITRIQPEKPSWNIMGMMNNCWYVVKPEIVQSEQEGEPHILFRHPVEPGTGNDGWMQPSEENKITKAKQESSAPQKQFTRQEIEKHCTEKDCWIVVDGRVYDATSVLSWHPGGKAAILGHAGKVHQETSDDFASVHDEYAYKKLKDCILGTVTQKAADFIKSNAEAAANERAKSKRSRDQIVLQKHRWVPVKLIERKAISKDTRRYTFALPDNQTTLGLGICQHVQLGFHLKDKLLIRSYTPTRPLLPLSNMTGSRVQPQSSARSETKEMEDGNGTFQLVVKTYFPNSDQPGGAMSNILDCIPIGEEVEIRGPTGDIVYCGNGKFMITENEMTFKKINLVLGGSGLTPGYALIVRVLHDTDDKVELRVIDANKSEDDILLHEELNRLEKEGESRLKITHILSHPSDAWKGLRGHVNADIIKSNLFPPGDDCACFLCGPPTMIQKVALPTLKGKLFPFSSVERAVPDHGVADWGFQEDKNIFGF